MDLPFSVRTVLLYKVQKTGLAFCQTRGRKHNYVIFGGLAIWLCFHNFRPMTLRPCFSAGLPFIGYFPAQSLAQTKAFALFNLEILPCSIARI
jgi:hypothetical protein